jgi:hypothetical protein
MLNKAVGAILEGVGKPENARSELPANPFDLKLINVGPK